MNVHVNVLHTMTATKSTFERFVIRGPLVDVVAAYKRLGEPIHTGIVVVSSPNSDPDTLWGECVYECDPSRHGRAIELIGAVVQILS